VVEDRAGDRHRREPSEDRHREAAGRELAELLLGERVGRPAESLETTEKSDEVRRRMPEAAVRRSLSRDELAGRLRDDPFPW